MKTFKKIIKKLTESKKTISTMESCTGGMIVSEITNIEGASEVLKYSAVTYSNEYKIKMGVAKETIEKYTVYSRETARAMAKAITSFANSNIGIGITGKLNRVDEHNPYGKDNIVYISLYDKDNDIYYDTQIEVTEKTRKQNKQLVVLKTIELIEENVL